MSKHDMRVISAAGRQTPNAEQRRTRFLCHLFNHSQATGSNAGELDTNGPHNYDSTDWFGTYLAQPQVTHT